MVVRLPQLYILSFGILYQSKVLHLKLEPKLSLVIHDPPRLLSGNPVKSVAAIEKNHDFLTND